MTAPDAEGRPNRCRGCGAPFSSDVPTPSHCGDCPPWVCDECGQTDSHANPCACWVPLKGMPLADIKALFAAGAPELSIDPRPSS